MEELALAGGEEELLSKVVSSDTDNTDSTEHNCSAEAERKASSDVCDSASHESSGGLGGFGPEADAEGLSSG